MLSAGRYLLGVVELGLIAGFATLGAAQLRAWLLPSFSRTPAHLATAVLALALLIWVAELLGAFGLFETLPYTLCVVTVGAVLWTLLPRVVSGWDGLRSPEAAEGKTSALTSLHPSPRSSAQGREGTHPGDRTRGRAVDVATVIGLLVAAAAVIHFAAEVRVHLSTGMTGFDSTWYHGPFAAGFFQSGNTFDLHFIAPQFLAWFYPANAEVVHAVGMLAFGRDILSPLLNLGWFAGCLVAAWCIGRPYGVASVSLALGAVALSVPALADQAGEARNDIVGIFFLLAAVAIALNSQASGEAPHGRERSSSRIPGISASALAVIGLAAGLAAGTKLNFLLPAAVLVAGLPLIAPSGVRWRAFATTGLAALAGGGYWYLRNLVHTGNPLPWIDHLGPISLPAPDQALGGREEHSVLGYVTDGSVWSDWFLPGLNDGLGFFWPLLGALALAGLLLCLGRRATPLLRVVGLVGLAAILAWLIAPTSASGPEGVPRGFESGLRYLAPALVLGLALLPLNWRLPRVVSGWDGLRSPEAAEGKTSALTSLHPSPRSSAQGKEGTHPGDRTRGPLPLRAAAVLGLLIAIAVGYPVQRHYLESRYSDPSFTAPGLNAAFRWARGISDARIATTSTRQYPLYGTDLSNRVEYVGVEQPHGGFIPPSTCPAWRHHLNAGDYDYVIATRDRLEPTKPSYPATALWTTAPNAKVVLRRPPTIIFQLSGPLDPSACR